MISLHSNKQPIRQIIGCLFFQLVFSPQPYDKLPGWFFLLAFLFLHPRRGFFRLPISPHAQFFLRNISISFQSGLSRLFFSSCTHAVGFSACHFLSTPTLSQQTCSAHNNRVGCRLLDAQKTTAYLTIHGGSKLLFTIYFCK
jgi:hypothetical protein